MHHGLQEGLGIKAVIAVNACSPSLLHGQLNSQTSCLQHTQILLQTVKRMCLMPSDKLLLLVTCHRLDQDGSVVRHVQPSKPPGPYLIGSYPDWWQLDTAGSWNEPKFGKIWISPMPAGEAAARVEMRVQASTGAEIDVLPAMFVSVIMLLQVFCGLILRNQVLRQLQR
jgi:hypothetical protein